MMTPKMVAAGLRRSLSFSTSNPSRPSNPDNKLLHVRSVSLPCRSHPLIPQLKDQISHLGAWASDAAHGPRTSAWLCHGLAHLKTAHDLLGDILHLPQTQDSLRRRRPDFLVDKLLEDFLRFVDAYGIFRTAILTLKQEHSAAQAAGRKRDDAMLAFYAKARKKIDKEMGRLASEIRYAGRILPVAGSNGDGELVGVIRDVIEATVLVSLALFNGIAASSSRRFGWPAGWRLGKKAAAIRGEDGIEEFQRVGEGKLWGNLRKKGDEEIRAVLKRMGDLEGWSGRIEIGSERVFRSLINTRVSLLNILTS